MRLGSTEILVILAVILIFFGGKRLPELGKALGRSLKSFKEGLEGNAGEGGEAPAPQESVDTKGTAHLLASNQTEGVRESSSASASPSATDAGSGGNVTTTFQSKSESNGANA